MEAQQVARRYAHGLFELTQEKGVSETVHRDFADLSTFLKQDATLLQFLAAPQIVDSDKATVIERSLKGKIVDQLYSLVQLLVEKHRTDFLLEIEKEYETLFHESRGIVKTKLVSAVPFSDQEINEIKTRLGRLTKQTIEIVTEVDPAIIGGVIAFVGAKIIDRSVRHDLEVLKEQLIQLKVN